MTKYLIQDRITGSAWEATDKNLSDKLHGLLDTTEEAFPGTIATVDTLVVRIERGDHYGYLENDLGITVQEVTE